MMKYVPRSIQTDNSGFKKSRPHRNSNGKFSSASACPPLAIRYTHTNASSSESGCHLTGQKQARSISADQPAVCAFRRAVTVLSWRTQKEIYHDDRPGNRSNHGPHGALGLPFVLGPSHRPPYRHAQRLVRLDSHCQSLSDLRDRQEAALVVFLDARAARQCRGYSYSLDAHGRSPP